jgi:DNA invertase Pin-like site-specific DNA recombinase
MRRAIGYVRVSTAEQLDGQGLEVQRQAIRAHARTHGIRLVETIEDAGLSGAKGEEVRLGLGETLARLEAGQAEALVVYRLDRLARDLVLQETIIERLAKGRVEVVSVTEPDIAAGDATRVLVRQVLGAIG